MAHPAPDAANTNSEPDLRLDAYHSIEFIEFDEAELVPAGDDDQHAEAFASAGADQPVSDEAEAADVEITFETAPATPPTWFRQRRTQTDEEAASEPATSEADSFANSESTFRNTTTDTAEAAAGRRAITKSQGTLPGLRPKAQNVPPANGSESRRRSRSRHPAAVMAAAAVAPPTAAVVPIAVADESTGDEERRPWKDIAKLWLLSVSASSYGLSLLLHISAMLVLSVVVYSTMESNDSPSLIVTKENALPLDVVEVAEFSMDDAGGSPETTSPQFQKLPFESVNSVLSGDTLTELASVTGEGNGEAASEGFGFMFKMPESGKAITRGSFMVWTVPEDPRPNQDYKIVIRIRLPEKTTLKTYRVADLTGRVVGTDGFRLSIPYDQNRPNQTRSERGERLIPIKPNDRLRVIDRHVQIVVDIPAASSLVRDMIHVESKMLDEEQDIEIVF